MTKRDWAIEIRRNSEAEFESTSIRFFSENSRQDDVERAAYLNSLFGFEKYRIVNA